MTLLGGRIADKAQSSRIIRHQPDKVLLEEVAMSAQEIARGLQVLLEGTRRYADHFPQKLEAMQGIYLQRNPTLYTPAEEQELCYYVKVVSYKFYLATLSLEQLWALSYTKREELVYALQNSLDKLECSDDEVLLSSFALESFLLQGRTFLDIYMLYICLVLRTGHKGKISTKRFRKELKKVQQEPLATKARKVRDYFDTKVFGTHDGKDFVRGDWGTLLQDLRDKITHRDLLRPSFESSEVLLDKVLFDWPTLQGMTYERFCQMMQNGMFCLITDVSPILYDLEWKAGPYRPKLWQ